jgi:hypothetical protein
MKLLLLRAAHYGVAQVLGSILFLASIGIGLSLIFAPGDYPNYALQQNFHMVAPAAWGTIFIIASLILVVTVWVDTEHAQLPALVLGIVYITFGFLSLMSGISPLIWAFVALGWISIFTQIICWAKEKRETLLYSNKSE